ncbi:Aste57867_18471 [Aphanomyces stellatus]|uniref:Aste57867_18471 protein n=1 Tax=Aphanomyces stellatus TaxID=120398 RepID=A0A485LBT1_9STRA|nr:hypothetical protein As57867_018409 [Aphanomyces stellatus]VFT95207.1 Aste57867_18471 [Aphanomyces stellatus]
MTMSKTLDSMTTADATKMIITASCNDWWASSVVKLVQEIQPPCYFEKNSVPANTAAFAWSLTDYFDVLQLGRAANVSTPIPSTTIVPSTSASITTTPQTTPTTEQPTTTSISSILGIAGGILVALVACFYLWRRRDRRQNDGDDRLFDGYVAADGTQSVNTKSTREVQPPRSTGVPLLNWRGIHRVRLAPSDIELARVLGTGASGEIWLGKYQHNIFVAVKKLHAGNATQPQIQAFIDEISLMATFRSEFIVELIGAAWSRPNTLACVLEFMNGGDLRGFLIQTTPKEDVWPTKLTWACQVANGLAYLHSLNIIHRDLKSRNILLGDEKPAKLADFGISRQATHETMTAEMGTCRWMAPEVLGDKYYTNAVDVYSFGVVLSELDTHNIPYTDLVNENGKPLSDMGVATAVRTRQLRPTFSAACPPPVLALAMRCMAQDPVDRPSAIELATCLRENYAAASCDLEYFV